MYTLCIVYYVENNIQTKQNEAKQKPGYKHFKWTGTHIENEQRYRNR